MTFIFERQYWTNEHFAHLYKCPFIIKICNDNNAIYINHFNKIIFIKYSYSNSCAKQIMLKKNHVLDCQ